MLARLAFGIVFVVGGCWRDGTTATTIPAPSTPATIPIAGTVRVWADAPLYLEHSTTAPRIWLAKPFSRTSVVGASAPMRVVTVGPELVEVEPVSGRHCSWLGFEAPSTLEHVRVFVDRRDLAPVLAKRFERRFEDATSIALDPGIAVTPHRGGYAVSVFGGTIGLPIPSTSIGLSYRWLAPDDEDSGDVEGIGVEGMRAHLGARTIELARGSATQVEGRPHRYRIREACRELVVRFDVDPDPEEGGGGFGYGTIGLGSLRKAVVDYLPAHTPLRSGRHVVARLGKARIVSDPAKPCFDAAWELQIDWPDDDEGRGHRRVTPTEGEDATMHLCADPRAVVHGPLPD